jgi:hypothetical protein
MKRSLHFTILTLAAGVLAFAPQARAALIISDAFSGTNGAALAGRTPDAADLPARTYATASVSTVIGVQPRIDTGAGNPANSADTGFNAATFIDISSAGGYTKPSQLSLSMSLQMNTIGNDGSAVRGIGLGFFSPAPVDGLAESSTNFTGLTVRPDGSLHFVVNGVQQAASVAAFGGYTTASFYNLAYSVDTVTGSITSVVFNGNDDTAAFSGAVSAGKFTVAGTNLAGFYGSSANSVNDFGRVDNFAVSTVPEPGTALFGMACIGAAAWRRRRRA